MAGSKTNYFKRAFRNNVYISDDKEWKVVRESEYKSNSSYTHKPHKWNLYSICKDETYAFVESFESMNSIKKFININKEIYA